MLNRQRIWWATAGSRQRFRWRKLASDQSTLLLLGFAVFSLFSFVSTAATAATVNVKNAPYNAHGDGGTDDTAAIQAAINAVAGTGGTVYVPDGIYLVNAVNSPLGLSNNMTFQMSAGAVLQAMTNAADVYGVIYAAFATNVLISGGTVSGERAGHTGTTGEWGMGVFVKGAQNLTVSNVLAKECWGDGFYVGADYTSVNVTFANVISDHNRRQGLSIEPCVNVLVTNSVFKNTQGTNPESGIDIEPYGGQISAGVIVSHCVISNNAGGGMYLDPNLSSGWAMASNCVIESNLIISNGYGGVVSVRPGIKVANGAANNIIRGNIIDQQNGIGLYAEATLGLTITNNVVTRTIRGGATYTEAGYGIEIWQTTNTICSFNVCTNNSGLGFNESANINLTATGNTVANNSVTPPAAPANLHIVGLNAN